MNQARQTEVTQTSQPYLRVADVAAVEMFPGVWRRTLLAGRGLMLVEFTLEAGASFPEHAHPHEQSGYVLSGALEMTIAGQSRLLQPGMTYFVPGGTLHAARAPERTVVVDAFSPPREEYRA